SGTVSATMTLNVTAVNDQPVATSPGPQTTDEDATSASFALTGSDVEDAVAAMTVNVTGGPAHGTLSASTGAAPLSVTYTPAADFNGGDSFTFTVTDSLGL